MPQRRRPTIKHAAPTALAVAKQAQILCRWRDWPPAHGNTKLKDRDVLIGLLCAFWEPLARSLRTIDQLSEVDAVQERLDVDRLARSTLSDALARFDTRPLPEIVSLLKRKLPQLRQGDPVLDQIVGKIIAMDASFFSMAGDVIWGLRQRNQHVSGGREARLDMQLDVRRMTPERFAVHGSELGSETASQQTMLERDVIYLGDRNYPGFEFLNHVFKAQAHVVLRFRSNIGFRVEQSKPLSEKDVASGVQFDELGQVGAERKDSYRKHEARPPAQQLRLVTIWDPAKQEQVKLLTDMLDLDAWIIGHLYRCRWMIEVFFRWFKSTAAMRHLISHSANGITVQFYVAMIATLLLHIQTGMPVSKYSLFALGMVARGQAQVKEVMPGLMRLERARMLEKQRLARKKAMKNKPDHLLR